MKTFYTYNIDIASPKSMWNFLNDHFTYSTMNSWNGMKSIAHNVKLYNLGLEGDWTVAMRYLMDEADSGALQIYINDEIREFERLNPEYTVGFNGRSGGYLVLYNKDNYRSVLPDCVLDFDTYEDFKADCKEYGYRVSDYLRELRDIVAVVRDFDKLCDSLRDLVNAYSKRSFDRDKLEDAVERFMYTYSEDLEALHLTGPEVEDTKVRLYDVAEYNAFMHCLIECFGADQSRVKYDDTYLWLEEV